MINMQVIGILSGTSMDSISLGLFEFSQNALPKSLAIYNQPLPANYKEELLTVINNKACTLETLGQMDNWIGTLFAEAILAFIAKEKIDVEKISCIGSHGQTIWHAPHLARPFTMQLGDPNIIAYHTKITTVADFRRADIAAGGCGAPLAPAFHQQIFAKTNTPRAIVNIGGFSNISFLTDKYLGFDSGPGNCLIDYWVQTHFSMQYDDQGKIAATGTVNHKLLNRMLQDSYFAEPAPKSTGHEYFNTTWLHNIINEFDVKFSHLEVLTTLLHLTATTIANEIKKHAPIDTEVYICGGGAYNNELCNQLGRSLERDIYTTSALGIEPLSVESALFAWLARERICNNPIDLTKITGSLTPVLLGGIYLPPRTN